jgi:hypothetical protein
MDAKPQPFDRQTIEKAFERLGELAVAAGKIVEISVYGGSALVLTLNHRPATRDVDAVFDRDRTFIRNAAQTIAAEFDWDEDWLNDGVKGFLSVVDSDPEAKRLMFTYPAEERPGLRVFVATAPYLFAMKSLAMRVGGADEKRDLDDIKRLGEVLGIRTATQALGIVSRYYAAEHLPPKTRFGLEGIFGAAEP